MSAVQRDWRLRLLAAAVLTLVYFTLWNPIRSVVAQHVAAPLIERSAAVQVVPGLHPAVIEVAGEERSWGAPAGLRFLLGAIALCLAAPRIAYVLGYLAAHLTLGVVSAVGLVVWLRSSAWGEILHDIVEGYLVDGLTLATMALAVTIFRIPLHDPAPDSGD